MRTHRYIFISATGHVPDYVIRKSVLIPKSGLVMSGVPTLQTLQSIANAIFRVVANADL